MLPFKSILAINKFSEVPLYLQICNAFIKNINAGIIQPGYKLPGSRTLSSLLEVNRRTIIVAYEELEAQGWIDIKANKGCFVSSKLPISHPRNFSAEEVNQHRKVSLFEIKDQFSFLNYYNPPNLRGDHLVIDAGYPDVRLAPLKQLSRHFSGIAQHHRLSKLFNYSNHFNGDLSLRKEVIQYLEDTRSINIDLGNILITRGSLVGFNLIFQVLLKAGDAVIVGDPGFHVANNIIQIAGGKLIKVAVDQKGIDVDAIETICKKQKIKAIFIMPHHHNPTTVSLSAERRMKLLLLAEKYRFAIIEDDYDYDYHYASSPILPMASSDRSGVVIYVGSLSKTVAPGLRVGFIVAPANMIVDLSRLSRFLDCHGNMALERSIGLLFQEGEIRRHLKKSLKIYHQRRDHFCELLESELGYIIEYDRPEGGLAAWVNFDPNFSINAIRKKAMTKGLLIPKSVFHSLDGRNRNAIRMGFASLTKEEMKKAIMILKKTIIKERDKK